MARATFRFLLLAFWASVGVAHAGSEFSNLAISARCKAMGGACVAFPTEQDAVYYNPAVMGGVQRLKLYLASVDLEASDDLALGSTELIGAMSEFSPEKINLLMGKNDYGRAQITSTLVMPHFGVAILVDDQVALRPENIAMPQIELGYQFTNGVQFAAGTSLFKNRKFKGDLRVGLGGKIMWRRGSYHILETSDLLNASTSTIANLTGGFEMAMGYDLGAQYILPINPRLTLYAGTAWENIGGLNFGGLAGTQADDLGVGFAVKYEMASMSAAFSYQMSNLTQESDWQKKNHIGLEFGLPMVTVYGGLNQRSWTYGAAFDAWLFRITAYSYSEALATYSDLDTERRYALNVTVKIGL